MNLILLLLSRSHGAGAISSARKSPEVNLHTVHSGGLNMHSFSLYNVECARAESGYLIVKPKIIQYKC